MTLMKRIRGMKNDEIVEKAIREWYLENNMPEPKWRQKKDPDWWDDYLREIDAEKE